MKEKYLYFRTCWYAANALLVISFGLVLLSAGWEFSTRSYLKGFSDAIVPFSSTSEQKVEGVLSWMKHGPARRSTVDSDWLNARNPEDTLNYEQLLGVCGTATNAFLNLAETSGLQARRLLLLDKQQRVTDHVVAEVLLDGRWIVVDPSHKAIFRLSNDRLLTRTELQNPAIFRAATALIPNYSPSYTFDETAHVHLSRMPWIGLHLRKSLDFVWPSWEESIDWTLLLERESFGMLTVSILLLCLSLAARLFLGWYSHRGLKIDRVRLRDQLLKAGEVLLSNSR